MNMEMDLLIVNKAIVVNFPKIDLPEPDIIEFWHNPVYENKRAAGKRYMAKLHNQQEVQQFFANLCNKYVFPKLVEEMPFRNEYPFSSEFLEKNTKINAYLLKDEIGWRQDFHNDNRTYVMAGSFHIQDSPGNGTCIYGENKTRDDEPVYITPSLKNSGAIWVNNNYASHKVAEVQGAERVFYLLHVLWNLDYSLFTPTNLRQYNEQKI